LGLPVLLGLGSLSAFAQDAEYDEYMGQGADYAGYESELEAADATASAAGATHASHGSCCNPCCDPCCNKCCGAAPGGVLFAPGFFAGGEFLLWRKRTAPTPFAGRLTPIAAAGVDAESYSLEEEENTYDLEAGYRVTLGFVTGAGWDLSASYTYFHNDGVSAIGNALVDSDSIFANRADLLLVDNENLNGDFDEGIVDFAKESRGIEYDVYDIEIGQYINSFDYVVLRVFGGLRGANIDEHSFVVYQNLEANTDTYLMESSVRMDGFGLRLGSVAHWAVGNTGLRVVGRMAVSMLYSDIRVSRVDAAIDVDDDTEIRRVAHDFNAVIPVAEVALGVNWDIGPFTVGAGYELTNWFNMYQEVYFADHDDINTATSTPLFDRGDWTLDGWYFNAGVIF
jgi:hypothetical protein